jgi:hypothetical protein
MRSVKVTLVVGLTLVATAVGVVLSSSPITVIGTDGVVAQVPAAFTNGNISGCQDGGTLPRGTSAIRTSVSPNIGPRISITVLAGARVVTRGERRAGAGEVETITVPVHPLAYPVHHARICTALGPAIGATQLNGTPIRSSSSNSRGLDGVALRMEYLRPGPRSWASLVPSISRKLGLGHAAGGTWIVFLLLAIMITVVLLTSHLSLKELR